jgi:hypothetical protein
MEILTRIAYTMPAYAICEREFVVIPNDTDIAYHGWKSPRDVLRCRSIRVEVSPIINLFLSKKRFGVSICS